MDIEFVDLPPDGRSKYPIMLQTIKEAVTYDEKDKWTELASFDKAPTARDTASRLAKEHPEFEFTSRKTSVYTRWKGE